MEGFIVYSALLLMPLFAGSFMGGFITILKCLKKDEPISGPALLASISFALMMWTLSATILLSAE
ncbi:hypothetical protein [Paenibacillus soyae]|uniref:Uncharacterized protein n=1 Tax=Paenibacillus soyae TaxID=2969249 RepID=A0A9X2MRR8_9BACL|nr:hypothetical protein [Paenibacillus soyae]MCR2805165.1 hypothetical protein [Paenibacillus soyae]